MFKSVDPKPDFPKLEERILSFWKKNKIFEKSVETRPANKTWTFLDGPPFITGLPHYGSLLSSIPKDLFPRFWTMKGYRVRRVWGWDCHGLPAENKVEEELKITRKKDIEEKIGVRKFIDNCKSYVQNVSSEWEWYIDHVGRWVDFRNAYKTMDFSYMETVMWVFKQIYDKGYIYKGLRVSLYCPHCVTPISNFEVAMDADNYKDLTEPTAVFKYPLTDEEDTYFLAWSTTPWNKIATPALAVNPDLVYVKVLQEKEKYILAKSALKLLINKPYKILDEFLGIELLGKKFIPHYNLYKIDAGKKAFIIIGGNFVTAEEGTGIVTIAAYGEEDLEVMQKECIQLVLHIDEEGRLKHDVPKWAGMYYLDVDPLVLEDLKNRNLIYRIDSYTHSIPTCWRCHTRLIYNPQNAWYINVQKLKEKMKVTNEEVNWFPAHFKHGRYLNNLESAPDWCISRSRYWGSPVPVWECACGERFVPGSINELEKASGLRINDLHKPIVDEIATDCRKCRRKARRVPEVLDSWIEAGSASLAERHYPFNLDEKLEEFFPPDFIAEYTGQIRAWFYVLHVISVALFDSAAYKNVLVTGVILGTDGRKMSKNYNNYPDPKEMLNKYGGDALRLYLMGSPVMHAEDIRISEEEYRGRVRDFILILWNIYNFFITYANIDGWSYKKSQFKLFSVHLLDRWIKSLLIQLVKDVTKYLELYDTVNAVKSLQTFIEKLSTWYIRRSRDRVGLSAEDSRDKYACYTTMYEVLLILSKLLAPFAPFLSEEIFKNLTDATSIHLSDWPDVNQIQYRYNRAQDRKLIEKMDLIRKVCELGHAKRKENNLKVRQPLRKIIIQNAKLKLEEDFLQLIKDELNVKKAEIAAGDRELSVELDTTITPELKAEGEAREIIRAIQMKRKEAKCGLTDKVRVFLPNWPEQFTDYIKKETLSEVIEYGNELKVENV
ncbi:isoleucine--tRNA ligase [Candidatus Gottesmanbacteria bacterium]|nr:isoleucine--tRNA ligase [Candidatus Gottesmanbacteria bacterium]